METRALRESAGRNGRRPRPQVAAIVVGVCFCLAACTGASAEKEVRAAGSDPQPVATGPPVEPSTTSTVPPSTAPPTSVVSPRPTQPAALRPTTTTRARATTTTTTTTTGPVEFQVPAENLAPRTEPPPLPSFAGPGFLWNTGWSGDPAGVDMTPPYQPPTVVAVSVTNCRLHQYGFDTDLWRITLSIQLRDGRYWWFPQRPEPADESAGTGAFIEYLTSRRQPDAPAGTIVDVPVTTVHLNSPSGVQFLPLTGVTAHCARPSG